MINIKFLIQHTKMAEAICFCHVLIPLLRVIFAQSLVLSCRSGGDDIATHRTVSCVRSLSVRQIQVYQTHYITHSGKPFRTILHKPLHGFYKTLQKHSFHLMLQKRIPGTDYYHHANTDITTVRNRLLRSSDFSS